VHECYRRQTDGRATEYSEREREFTFANEHYSICLTPVFAETRGQTKYDEMFEKEAPNISQASRLRLKEWHDLQ